MSKIDKSKDKRIGYNQRHAVFYDLKITDAILLNYIQRLKRKSKKVPGFYPLPYKNLMKRLPMLSKQQNFFRAAFKRLEKLKLIEREYSSNILFVRSLPIDEAANEKDVIEREFCYFNPDHLSQGVNIQKAILINYLMDLHKWANYREGYYRITYKKMRDDLISLSDKAPYFKDRIKELRAIKVVERHPDSYKTYLRINIIELENLAKKGGEMDDLKIIENNPSRIIENNPISASEIIENNPPYRKEIEKKDNSSTTTLNPKDLKNTTSKKETIETTGKKTTSDYDLNLLALKKAKSKPPPNPLDAVIIDCSKGTANNGNLPKGTIDVPNSPESKIEQTLRKHFKTEEELNKSIDLDMDLPTALEKFKIYFMDEKEFKPNFNGGGPKLIIDCWEEFVGKKRSRKNEVAEIEALMKEKGILIHSDYTIPNAEKAGVTLSMVESIIDLFMTSGGDKSSTYLFSECWVAKMNSKGAKHVVPIKELMIKHQINLYHKHAVFSAVKAGITFEMVESIIDEFVLQCSNKSSIQLFGNEWVDRMDKEDSQHAAGVEFKSMSDEIAAIQELMKEKQIDIYHGNSAKAVKAGITFRMVKSVIYDYLASETDWNTRDLFSDHWTKKMKDKLQAQDVDPAIKLGASRA